jgi:signal transduction histidine kinase
MIMVKNLTNLVKYEKLRMENHFYEMLTATVSHDMRTPLNAMIGLLNNLDTFVIDGPGKKYLAIILNSSRFMLFLVNDLLDFFQIKNGKFRKNI